MQLGKIITGSPELLERKFYNLSEPDLGPREKEALVAAFDSGWISSKGKFVEEFELLMTGIAGTNFGLSTNNGTTALHLAMLACGIQSGDEVIVPAVTYIAAANAVQYVGAIPVFADVVAGDLTLDIELLESLVTEKTRAIVAVHLYGIPVDISSLRKFCDSRNLYLIEDCAEAHGAKSGDVKIGSLGDVSVFSFYGNKIISTGEGGFAATNSQEIYEKMCLLRGQGMDPNRRYWFPVVGYNYRMTNLAAALGFAQLSRFSELLEKRNLLNQRYFENLKQINVELSPSADKQGSVPWLRNIFLKNVDILKRDELITKMDGLRVETRPVFIPLYQLPPYWDSEGSIKFPESENWANRGVSLPLHTKLELNDVDNICEVLDSLINSL